MGIFSKIGSGIGGMLKEVGQGIGPAIRNTALNNPQGAGLLRYASDRITKGESGFRAYGTPLKLLGAGGALTLAAGAYSGATNTQDSDNALIGGMKGMLNSFSNFGENVLMPASIGVGALAATGFTRKFETGYMLTRRAANARSNYAASESFKKEGRGNLTQRQYNDKSEGLHNATWWSIHPGGRAPKGGPVPGDSNSRNAVDRTTHLLIDRGEEVYHSRSVPTEIISELIEKDSKGATGILGTIAQGGSSMGYAVGGFMGEMDIAMGKAYQAFRAGKNAGKTPYEIKKEKEAKKAAKEALKKRTPDEIRLAKADADLEKQRRKESGNAGADLVSGLAKIGAIAGVIGAGAYAGASAGNTGYFAGSPLNVLSRGLSTSRNEADYIYSTEQQKMGQYEMVAAYNPSQAGMRDTDDAYSYARSVNPSSVNPMSSGLAKTAGKQRTITPGQYGDSGNLVLAMNTLRRG